MLSSEVRTRWREQLHQRVGAVCVGPEREEREVTRHPSSSPFPPQVSNLPKEATSFDLFQPETLTHFGFPPH